MNEKLALLLDSAQEYFRQINKLTRMHSLEDEKNAVLIRSSGAAAKLRARFREIDDDKYKLEDEDKAIAELNEIIEEQKDLIVKLELINTDKGCTDIVDMFVDVSREEKPKHTLAKATAGVAITALAAYGVYRLCKSK